MLNNNTTVNSSSTIRTTLLPLGKLIKASCLTKTQLTTSISKTRTNLKGRKNSINSSLMLGNAPLRRHKIISASITVTITTHRGNKTTKISSDPNPSKSVRSS